MKNTVQTILSYRGTNMFENEALYAFCNVDSFHTGEEHAGKREQAHIYADEHARTCDDEDCDH